MARIYKQPGSRVYYSDIYIPGHPKADKKGRVRIPLSPERRIAEMGLAVLIKKRDSRKYGAAAPSDSYEEAKERILTTRKSKITRRHYERAFRNLEAESPIQTLPQITPDILVNLYIKWKEAGRGLYVRNRDIGAILGLMRRSEKRGAIEPRDWDAVVEIMDKEPRGRVDFFTPEELGRLIRNTTGCWRTMVYLGARAGLRPSEMYWLEWSDIDFASNKIHVDSKPKYGHHVKTYERRTIPMPADLRAYLKTVFKENGGQFVLTYDDGSRPASTDVMSSYFSRRVRATKLKGHLYKLRHTFGSHLAQANRRLEEIRDLMGHKDTKTTEIYVHLLPSALSDAINSLPKIKA